MRTGSKINKHYDHPTESKYFENLWIFLKILIYLVFRICTKVQDVAGKWIKKKWKQLIIIIMKMIIQQNLQVPHEIQFSW